MFVVRLKIKNYDMFQLNFKFFDLMLIIYCDLNILFFLCYLYFKQKVDYKEVKNLE